jgi:hypothetical protein
MNQGGVDVDCSAESPPYYTRHVCDAVKGGAVQQTDVDRAARRYWRTLMRLGMFDEMEQQPMVTKVGVADVDNAANRALAQQTVSPSQRLNACFCVRYLIQRGETLLVVRSVFRFGGSCNVAMSGGYRSLLVNTVDLPTLYYYAMPPRK